MARTTPPPRDHVDPSFVRGVEDAVRRAGAVPLARLTREKLTPGARAALEEQLAASGLERTAKTMRVPLADQILALVQAGARVPVKELGKRVKGASPAAEIKTALDGLRKQGRARVVIRTELEVLVGPAERVLDPGEVAQLVKLGAALGKTLKKVGARGLPRALLREDVAALLAPLEAITRSRAEPAGDGAAARRELLDAAVARLSDPTLKLARVPDLVRALAERLPTAEVHRALEEAAFAGWLELRPEAGGELLKPEDAALCPPGPRGTVLFFARRLAP